MIELAKVRGSVWVGMPADDGEQDTIEISWDRKYDAVTICFTSPYKLPGLVVQALARLERGQRHE
ncbi:hypothetical protein [Acutalibacter sp. JLR.KK004]|jgi:hypothetical protein|uniref:hypothetical protein n=1 Tax=Acutalibacter sp. JLR.KK004 TaxID=3112622 RepID=UPI002FF3E306